MDLFHREAIERIGADDVLSKVDALLEWQAFGPILKRGFVRSDEEGYIDKVHATPANRSESPEFESMIEGTPAQRVLADKAYASRANREALRGKHRDGIMRKAARNRSYGQKWVTRRDQAAPVLAVSPSATPSVNLMPSMTLGN